MEPDEPEDLEPSAVAPSPFEAVPTALADGLEAIRWNGKPWEISVDVRAPSGLALGHVDIRVRPFAALLANGHCSLIGPATFIRALRGDWPQLEPSVADEEVPD
jgi:hypothetical protein